jgi:hypothetical protein
VKRPAKQASIDFPTVAAGMQGVSFRRQRTLCQKRARRFVPITGPEQSQQKSPLLDHLVGAGKQAGEKCS